jgi:hypothetical protein
MQRSEKKTAIVVKLFDAEPEAQGTKLFSCWSCDQKY